MPNTSQVTPKPRMVARWVEVLGWLSLTWLIRTWPIWLQGKTFFFGDLFGLFVPGKIFTAQWLSQGMIPTWNPYILGGIDWIGDISQSILYPSSWLFVLVRPAEALTITLTLHWLILGAGVYAVAYRLSRHQAASVMAALTLGLAPVMTASLHNLAIWQTLAWWPWLVLAGLLLPSAVKTWQGCGRWWLVAAAVLAVQIYTGYPPLVVLSLLSAGLLTLLKNWGQLSPSLWRKSLGLTLAALSLAIVWAAPAILPFIPAVLNSTRPLQTSTQALTGALHPAELAKILVPYIFDWPAGGVKWGPIWSRSATAQVFLGVSGLLVLALGNWWGGPDRRVVRGLSLVGLLALLLALGEFMPGHHLVSSIPGWSAVRSPQLWLFLTQFSWTWAVAISWPQLWPRLVTWAVRYWSVVVKASAIILLPLLGFAGWSTLQPEVWWQFLNRTTLGKLESSQFHTVARDQVLLWLLLMVVVLGIMAGLASWWAVRRQSWRWLILVVMFEGILQSQGGLWFAPANLLLPPSELSGMTNFLVRSQGQVLIKTGSTEYADLPAYWDALTVRAPFSDSFVGTQEIKEWSHLESLKQGLTPNWNMTVGVPSLTGYTTLMPATVAQYWRPDPTVPLALNVLPPIAINNVALRSQPVRYYLVDTWYQQSIPELDMLAGLPKLYEQGRWQLFQLPPGPRLPMSPAQTVTTVNPSFEWGQQLMLGVSFIITLAAAVVSLVSRRRI